MLFAFRQSVLTASSRDSVVVGVAMDLPFSGGSAVVVSPRYRDVGTQTSGRCGTQIDPGSQFVHHDDCWRCNLRAYCKLVSLRLGRRGISDFGRQGAWGRAGEWARRESPRTGQRGNDPLSVDDRSKPPFNGLQEGQTRFLGGCATRGRDAVACVGRISGQQTEVRR